MKSLASSSNRSCFCEDKSEIQRKVWLLLRIHNTRNIFIEAISNSSSEFQLQPTYHRDFPSFRLTFSIVMAVAVQKKRLFFLCCGQIITYTNSHLMLSPRHKFSARISHRGLCTLVYYVYRTCTSSLTAACSFFT